MDGERWQQIQNILDEIFDLPPHEQEAIIVTRCSDDTALAQEVRSFLAADAQSNALFNQLSEPMEEDLTVTVMQAAKTFDQYEIIQKIGIGGMGVVYKVWDKRLERHIALKYLSPKLILDATVRKQFKTEARAASRIDHPNICAIYDIGESTEHQLYFTMPFYKGKDLGKHIAQGNTNPLQMAAYALQIAAGLAAAHAEDILHRDIKPGNIMITDKGIVKILDFGIAKIVDSDATTTQLMAGSTAYMSPEQTLGYKLDARADIWSFGVVLYEMFSGQLPFEGKDNAQITQAVLAGELIPIQAQENAPKSKTLQKLIERTLQTDLNKRCAQLSELFPDLQRLQSELSESQETGAPSINLWPLTEVTQTTITPRRKKEAPITELNPALDQQTFLASRPTQRLHLNNTNKPAESAPGDTERAQTMHTAHEQALAPQTDLQQANKTSLAQTIGATTLKQVEQALAPHVGPVARVMVRRGQRKTHCIQSLCELLATSIEPEQARTEFLKVVEPLW